MTRIYADLVKAGRKTFAEVPENLKSGVREILKSELTPEKYTEITGETYVA
jgi:hypothetical protein